MATKIDTFLPQGTYFLTSRLPTIVASTDSATVVVSIVRASTSEEIFATELYPYNGKVSLEELGTIIEENLRQNARIADQYIIHFDDAITYLDALYCEYSLSEDFNPQIPFLTASHTSIVRPSSIISLILIRLSEDERFNVKIIGLDHEGQLAVFEYVLGITFAEYHGHVSVSTVIAPALTVADGETYSPLASVSYFVVSSGLAEKVFYVVDYPYSLCFSYRNIFNAEEFIDVPGTVTRKTKFDADASVCSGRLKQYNRSSERTYEMLTSPLTAAQVNEMTQLIGSHEIYLIDGSDPLEVIITDHTIEVSNDDESLSTIKFAFRFADERIVLPRSDLGGLNPTSSNIFSEQFTREYS